jgi:hypothetical protein
MKLIQFKSQILFALLILITLSASSNLQAQDHTKLIGNKARKGSSNSSFPAIKGQQVGIKMNAGRKPVQLLKLNFGVDNRNKEAIKFKVNIYEFSGDKPGEAITTKDIIASIPNGKNRVDVDLSPYKIVTKGDILASIEFLSTSKGSEPVFSIGLFNGGTYRYEIDEWKKMPIAGVDFNVLVKKIK